MNYRNYALPQTLEEAWVLNQKKSNRILAGNLWLRLRKNPFDTAIDLSALGLSGIEETEDCWRIGCMTALHELERHEGLNGMTDGAFRAALKGIVGVQFRNCATVGGSVYGRFGFSDVLTLLMALESRVVLYKGGCVALTEFARAAKDRDILMYVEIPKGLRRVSFQCVRTTKTGFSVLNCAVARRDGKTIAAVGARPGRAECLVQAEDDAALIARAQRELTFDGNALGSAEYRRHLAGVLLRRALKETEEGAGAE